MVTRSAPCLAFVLREPAFTKERPGFNLDGRATDYFSRSQTILRKSVLPGNSMLGAGADSMNSLSPSILKWRLCSVPFQSSFQETSKAVMKSLPSNRYLLDPYRSMLIQAERQGGPHLRLPEVNVMRRTRRQT
jgi:hypothetical protein